MKCSLCGKELTESEEKYYWGWNAGREEKPICYPCKLKIFEKRFGKKNEKKAD